MTAGGAVLTGCSLEEGGAPPSAKKGAGEDVDIGKIQPSGRNDELEKLAGNWKPYDGSPVELSIWMYPQDERSLAAYKKARCCRIQPEYEPGNPRLQFQE